MADRIKIGTTRINLDNVAYVEELEEAHYNLDTHEKTMRPFVKIYFNVTISSSEDGQFQEPHWLRFSGDDALLFLAIWDGDDEEVDRLMPLVNGAKAQPICAFLHCRALPVSGSKFCAAHQHLELPVCPVPECEYPARYTVHGQVSCWAHIPMSARAGEVIDITTGEPIITE